MESTSSVASPVSITIFLLVLASFGLSWWHWPPARARAEEQRTLWGCGAVEQRVAALVGELHHRGEYRMGASARLEATVLVVAR